MISEGNWGQELADRGFFPVPEAFEEAALRGRWMLAADLFDQGLCPSQKHLAWAARLSMVQEGPQEGTMALIRRLKEPEALRRGESSLLGIAAMKGNLEAMRALRELGAAADPEPGQDLTWSPLCAAVKRQQADAVGLLLEWGADPDRAGAWGDPVLLALQGQSRRILELLLKSGASADPSTERGAKIFQEAISEGVSLAVSETYFRSLSEGKERARQMLLRSRKADPDALIQAILSGVIEAKDALGKAGSFAHAGSWWALSWTLRQFAKELGQAPMLGAGALANSVLKTILDIGSPECAAQAECRSECVKACIALCSGNAECAAEAGLWVKKSAMRKNWEETALLAEICLGEGMHFWDLPKTMAMEGAEENLDGEEGAKYFKALEWVCKRASENDLQAALDWCAQREDVPMEIPGFILSMSEARKLLGCLEEAGQACAQAASGRGGAVKSI